MYVVSDKFNFEVYVDLCCKGIQFLIVFIIKFKVIMFFSILGIGVLYNLGNYGSIFGLFSIYFYCFMYGFSSFFKICQECVQR